MSKTFKVAFDEFNSAFKFSKDGRQFQMSHLPRVLSDLRGELWCIDFLRVTFFIPAVDLRPQLISRALQQLIAFTLTQVLQANYNSHLNNGVQEGERSSSAGVRWIRRLVAEKSVWRENNNHRHQIFEGGHEESGRPAHGDTLLLLSLRVCHTE